MAPGSLAARIPKIHLHCHLEGCMRASTFVELAEKHGVSLRYKPSFETRPFETLAKPVLSEGEGLAPQDDTRASQDDKGPRSDPYRFESFQEFLYLFAAVSRALREPEDYARLAREFVEDALAQGVIYGELFVSPPVWTFFNRDLGVRETMEAIVEELRRAHPRATFKLLPDVTRNFGPERAMEAARAMAALTELDVIGISLGGDERRFPAELFTGVFEYARSQGLHCVAHAGEAGDANSVRGAVEFLHAERIGHGIRALEDPRTVALLAQSGVALEICPTSNRLTGSALAKYPHPYVDFDRNGCVVTIDGDDPSLFKTSISQEYANVEEVAGSAALERYVRNAIRASFANAEAKLAMESQLDAAVAEPSATHRS